MDSEVVGTAEISALIVHSCSHAVAAWPRCDLCGWRRLCFGSASLPHPTLSTGFLALCRLIEIISAGLLRQESRKSGPGLRLSGSAGIEKPEAQAKGSPNPWNDLRLRFRLVIDSPSFSYGVT